MKKIFTLIALVACFMNAKAVEVVDAYVDFSTVTEIPRFAWGGSESAFARLSLQNGCLHFHSEEATNPSWDCQWFPIGGVDAQVGVTYTLHFKVKGDHTEYISALGFGQTPYGQFPITTEWVEGTFDYECTEANGNLLFQAGAYVGDFDIAYLKITHEGATPAEPAWVQLIANGDAEQTWEELGLANVNYLDNQNNYKVSVWVKEKGHNLDAYGSSNPFPANIETEEDGNHVFVCHGQLADTEGDESGWDNQIWLQSPREWKTGEKYRISFRYKASTNVTVPSQFHRQTPSDYLYWLALGDINFTTEWQTIEATGKISADANGAWSIGFNLNTNDTNPIDFYIDDFTWELDEDSAVGPYEDPEARYWEELITNGDAEQSWEELGLADVAFYDTENNYKVCVWKREKGRDVYEGNPGASPANIETEEDGNHVFVCHGQLADTEGEEAAWDNQIWLQSPRQWRTGEVYRISFRYKASTDVTVLSQYHRQTPSDYIYWDALGDINFATDWQQFEGEFSIPVEANGAWSIAFNLNANDINPIDFYIDDLSWKLDTRTINNEDITTGITEVKTSNAKAVYYNLAGQRVNENAKGIVIYNGKKYLNK